MFDDVLTVRRYPTVTDHGAQRPDFTGTPVEFDVLRCDAQPGATDELLGRRDTTKIAWTVYVPVGTDVRSTDQAVLNHGSTVFAVSGEPGRWGTGTNALDHGVVFLEVWR